MLIPAYRCRTDCSQEATLDEEALDEEEREDRYMAAAFDVFMDYRNWD